MLTFRPNLLKDKEKDFSLSQKFIDSEVLRLSDQYVPMQTGMLKKSGTNGTVIGSGVVKYNAPYARIQYYSGRSPGSSTQGPLRGRMWFERMKADHKDEILKGAKKAAGAK
ncbi:MAG: minor capsid protein [Oscillospiraceae bacterium]|nr:minor capsid protein [Oscillospiraceae bacterium]